MSALSKVDLNQEKTNPQFANMNLQFVQLKNSLTLTMLTIVGVAIAISGFLIKIYAHFSTHS